MAGGKSNWLENAVVDHLIGRSSTGLSTGLHSTLWLSLWASTLNDASTPLDTGECTGTNYARLAVTNSSANWTNSSSGLTRNKTVFTVQASASSDWGPLKAFMFSDSSSTSAGNSWYWGDLTGAPVSPSSGVPVRFSTGTLVIGET